MRSGAQPGADQWQETLESLGGDRSLEAAARLVVLEQSRERLA